MPDIRPYEGTPEELAALSELFRSSFPFGGHMSVAYLDWTYGGNPDGPTVALSAYAEGCIVAHFALTAFRGRLRGQEELGVQMQHAATHPDHQRKGLFVSLVGHALDLAAERGYGFAVGPANLASTPIFVSRLAFQSVRPFDVRVGIGPLPRRRTGTASEPDFERVFSAKALAWRLARPDLPYRVRRERGRARIFVAGPAGIPIELGSYPSADVPRTVPAATLRHPLRAWIGLDPERTWWGRPFLNVPVRLRPAPLNFIFRDLTGRGRRLEPRLVRADMLDYDAF